VVDSYGNVVTDSVTVSVAIPAIPSVTGTLAVEGCHNGQFTITLPFTVNTDYTIHYTIGGTATNGVDYTTITDSLVITSGNNSGTIIINPLTDSTNTNNETITITIHRPSACGGDTTVTLTIVNVRPLAMTLTADTALCLGQSVDLNVSPSGGYKGYNFVWNQGLNNDSIQTVTPNVNTTYTVSISDSCGHTLTDSVHVRVIPVPLVGVTISPRDSMCDYDNAIISFTDSLLLNGTTTINFDGGTATGSGLGPYTVNWQVPGYYTIYFTANSEKSCWSSTDTIGIYVKDCEIHVPNVFTPNGDGKNDYFYIVNMSEFPDSHLIVYDRWGLKVYESTNYHNEWNGSNVVDGTYYYILSLNTGKQLHGDITVIRGK
jgi:gliding motility-associated-like protein